MAMMVMMQVLEETVECYPVSKTIMDIMDGAPGVCRWGIASCNPDVSERTPIPTDAESRFLSSSLVLPQMLSGRGGINREVLNFYWQHIQFARFVDDSSVDEANKAGGDEHADSSSESTFAFGPNKLQQYCVSKLSSIAQETLDAIDSRDDGDSGLGQQIKEDAHAILWYLHIALNFLKVVSAMQQKLPDWIASQSQSSQASLAESSYGDMVAMLSNVVVACVDKLAKVVHSSLSSRSGPMLSRKIVRYTTKLFERHNSLLLLLCEQRHSDYPEVYDSLCGLSASLLTAMNQSVTFMYVQCTSSKDQVTSTSSTSNHTSSERTLHLLHLIHNQPHSL